MRFSPSRRLLRPLIGITAAGTVAAGITAAVAAPGAAPDRELPKHSFPSLAVVMDTHEPKLGIRPGAKDVRVTGVVHRSDTRTGQLQEPTAAELTLRLRDAHSTLDRRITRVRTDQQGRFSAVVPADATRGVSPTARTQWREVLAVDATEVRELEGNRAEATAGSEGFLVAAAAVGLQVENSFVSSTGWVKPGDSYPFRVLIRNYDNAAKTNAEVRLESVKGMVFEDADVLSGGGSVSQNASSITWDAGNIAAGSAAAPTVETLVVEARAKTFGEDERVVWRNLSTLAKLTHGGGSDSSRSHGPRVIPPGESYETARFGDRPFPVVPVDYLDFKHAAAHPASDLDSVINGRNNPGSTFNLYQEMSLGQLFPNGTVPSAGIASADYPATGNGRFTTMSVADVNTCQGATLAQINNGALLAGQPRISDGWYQLPGMRGYYGADANGSAVVGAVAGVPQLQAIDDGCGPAAKLAYDAAVAADADIDYSDYDTDKDGVVDFFEVIFQGVGGHGASQTSVPPYDNIWPHSSTLESSYVDPATGLQGYISQDQLKDLEGRLLWYTNSSRTQMTTQDKGNALKVFVRVGPYNVNPEDSIDHASVISHEYGHSLGAPDFYSTGSRVTYGDWNLMASDYSQNATLFPLQEWGWVVPRPLKEGKKTKVNNWSDTKLDTHRIHWQTPDGEPYTLKGSRVHNAEAYTAKLPGRRILDPAKVRAGASPSHVWWSRAGNDFGCAPLAGHNLDIALPQLKKVSPGTTVTLTYKAAWEIEWDYDYAFVMLGIPNAQGAIPDYVTVPSENGYTTRAATNPNSNQCQAKYGNGITGSSTSWANGTQAVDRRGVGDVTGLSQLDSYPDFRFIEDSFDISALAGKDGVLRFSYATDPGLAKAGWFIDDIKITAGSRTIYESDFEGEGDQNDPSVFNGGCKDTVRVAGKCTAGWQFLNVSKAAPFDHGYYMGLRDRSGFDRDGHGQADRGAITFQPGLLLEYTDEAHGYGNVGTDDPPAQSPLDQQPEPGNGSPNLADAAFKDNDTFSDRGAGHVDNYSDPSTQSGNWEFKHNCLKFTVNSMKGETPGPTFPDIGEGGNLSGDVTFDLGTGCAAFDYGFGVPNEGPTAVIEVKPRKARVGEPVTFNASQSFDDFTAPSALKYRWDFDGDGENDARGATVQHRYTQAGDYRARLVVIDGDGERAVARATVTVTRGSSQNRPGTDGPGGLAATGAGGWVAPVALLLMTISLVGVRLRVGGARRR